MSFVVQRTKRSAHGRTGRSLLLFVNCLKGNIRVLKDLKDPKDLNHKPRKLFPFQIDKIVCLIFNSLRLWRCSVFLFFPTMDSVCCKHEKAGL